jgi:hypothetical protein
VLDLMHPIEPGSAFSSIRRPGTPLTSFADLLNKHGQPVDLGVATSALKNACPPWLQEGFAHVWKLAWRRARILDCIFDPDKNVNFLYDRATSPMDGPTPFGWDFPTCLTIHAC